MRKFYIIGTSFKEANCDDLGKFFLKGDKLIALKNLLKQKNIPEFVLLSTCNRFEIYFAGEDDNLQNKVWDSLEKIFKDDFFEYKSTTYAKEQLSAIEHIFSLASGLESEITGETEILGQLKNAYQEYQKEKLCSTILNQVFQKAIHVGKWIRTNTEIGRGKITTGSVAAELATRIFGELKNSNILLMGSGEVGKSVAKALSVRGVGLIAVLSRTWQNALDLSKEISAMALPYESLFDELERWDIIITALSHQENILTKESIAKALKKRTKPLFIIDLAMPTNVETSCQELSDVYLYRLADLANISKENIESLQSEIDFSREEIADRAKNCLNKLFNE